MAIQVNSKLVTNEGFALDGAFAFLNIYLLNDDWVNVIYYKSETDWQNGAQPLNVELPARVALNLNATEFWGDELILGIHTKVLNVIESETGVGTCTIITTE